MMQHDKKEIPYTDVEILMTYSKNLEKYFISSRIGLFLIKLAGFQVKTLCRQMRLL